MIRLIASLAMALAGLLVPSTAAGQSVCTGASGLTIHRVAERTFDVCSPELRYRFDAGGPGVGDPRYTGDTQIRLRELWWHSAPGAGAEVMLLQCGQCDFLAAISLDGTGPQWAGGGHGFESGPLWSLTLDGVVVAGQADGALLGSLAVGGAMSGVDVMLHQTTVGYAAAGPIPVYQQSMQHTITPDRYDFAVDVVAVAGHALHLDYAIMAQGVTWCDPGGIWAGAELDGVPIVGPVPCNLSSSRTTNHGPGSEVALVNSDATVRLLFEASTPRGFRCVERADAPHLKCYGRSPDVDSYNAPIMVAPGHRRSYQHSMRLVVQ